MHLGAVEEAHAEQDEGHVSSTDLRIDIVQDNAADFDGIELETADTDGAIGGLRITDLPPCGVQTKLTGLPGAKCHPGRPGIDQKAHGAAIDPAQGQKVPLTVGAQHHLGAITRLPTSGPGNRGRSRAASCRSWLQPPFAAINLQHCPLAIHTQQTDARPHRSHGKSPRGGSINRQQGLAANDASQTNFGSQNRTGSPHRSNEANRYKMAPYLP